MNRFPVLFAGALFLTSVIALVLQQIGACGSCAIHQGPWTFVAPAGVIGYAVLVAIGFLSPQHLFPIGAMIAAALHTVLIAAMAVTGKFCPICIVAAALALALLVVTLVQNPLRVKLLAWVYVPTLLVASAPALWALGHEDVLKGERDAFVRGLQNRDSVLTIQVFEQDHCSYCRDFREVYLPRLNRDFGDRVRVRFLEATSTTWVRRTPTIVIEAGPIYEGLPENYTDLKTAVDQALSSGK